MSLPLRLHSSSPPTGNIFIGPGMPANITTLNLKRKASIIEEDEEEGEGDDYGSQQPRRKVAAVGTTRPIRPLQPTRSAANGARSVSGPGSVISTGGLPHAPKPLTKPRPPALTTRTTRARARGTSAPPTRNSSNGLPPRIPSGSATTLQSAKTAAAARLAADLDAEHTKLAQIQTGHLLLTQELASQEFAQKKKELVNFSEELEEVRKKHAEEIVQLEADVMNRDHELQEVTEELRVCREDLDKERAVTGELSKVVGQTDAVQLQLKTQIQTFQNQNDLLQKQNEQYAAQVAEYQLKLDDNQHMIAELKQEILESEIVRRKLHNMVQELKGNIRVFCRVRPVLPSDFANNPALQSLPSSASSSSSSKSAPRTTPENDLEQKKRQVQANMSFPDRQNHKEIVLTSTSESATGQERKEVYNFAFDHVFEPSATQAEVFEEISLLAQSCMDGYNVCIFAYGQTGSGKSFTMEGGQTETMSGMIPRAVEQVFRVAKEMKSKGWEYQIEGQFLEIYNETINDLLGKAEFDKKKHEIKHDPKTSTTRVTDLTVIPLKSPSQVRTLLALAHSRRSVAATLMNERSSRSHSVFTLRISGTNVGFPGEEGGGGGGVEGTGERCEGCLNLVDLAGSERLNVSFASGPGAGLPDKERVRETQSINKSLSALGDVIAALGSGAGENKHVPYRNSKLTYLLQNSLSGNSKTLMFLNLSPLAVHFNESLTSLRFATKVNHTQINTAAKKGSRS